MRTVGMCLLPFYDNKPGCSSRRKLNVLDGRVNESQNLRSGRDLMRTSHPIHVPWLWDKANRAQRVDKAKGGWGRGGAAVPLQISCLTARCSLYCYVLSLSTKQNSHFQCWTKHGRADMKTTANTYQEPIRCPSEFLSCAISWNICDKPTGGV